MTKPNKLTKNQIWGVHLLQGFFEALRKDQLPDFLKSDDLERFLHEAAGGSFWGKQPGGITGSFGDKFPEGGPGSKLPSIGGEDPLDVLQGLFHGIGSDLLGKMDPPGGADPAGADGDQVVTEKDGHGNITTFIIHADGTRESFTTYADGGYSESRIDANGRRDYTNMTPDRSGGGFTVEKGYYERDGSNSRTIVHYERNGTQSPGEDGGVTNSGRNPLSGVETLGPQSMEQMVSAMQHPGKDPKKVDPNSGEGGLELSEADKEKLGLTVAGVDLLDPNSGLDPLTLLNLDPNKMNSGSKNNDELDPNNGLKPVHSLKMVK